MSIILFLLDKGAERGCDFLVPTKAAQENLCDVALRLVWEKNSLSIPDKYPVEPSSVYEAAFYGNNPLLNLFLEMGADPNDEWYGKYGVSTPLVGALYSGRPQTVKLLLQHGPDTSSNSRLRITAAEFARDEFDNPRWFQDGKEKRKIVKHLLELGYPG